jgi:hypothetical protein
LAREENSAKLIKRLGLDYESGGSPTLLKKALASREKEAWGLTVRVARQVCSRALDVVEVPIVPRVASYVIEVVYEKPVTRNCHIYDYFDAVFGRLSTKVTSFLSTSESLMVTVWLQQIIV